MNDDEFEFVVKNRKRSVRRHHKQRMKDEIKDKYLNNWQYKDVDERTLGIESDTQKRCSCWMCGNPRKYFGDIDRNEIYTDCEYSYGEILIDAYNRE